MEKIPTAEEFATEFDNARMPRGVSYYQEIGELMIDFAKLHVKAALKSAADTAEVEFNTDFHRSQFESCYSLNDIK